MTRHFACVGEWEEGRLRLEAAVLCTWLPTTNQRRSLLLAFPRAGALLTPLSIAVHLGAAESRAELRLAAGALGQGREQYRLRIARVGTSLTYNGSYTCV